MAYSDIFVYFIKILAIQGVFYLFYCLVLRQNANHSLNRLYLIGTLLFSLVIPFIHHPLPAEAAPVLEVTMLEWVATPIDSHEIQSVNTTEWSSVVWTVLKWLYITLVLVFVLRSLFHLYMLRRIKRQSECVNKHWYTLFKTTHTLPFSFFSNVFIPKKDFGSAAFDQILTHECVHVRQMHSLDRLLVDFLVSLFWFNPFIYLYRNALIEVHEYEADAAVIRQYGDPIGYQEMLFAQLQPVGYSGLVSHFNFSTIKKRIVMMNNVKNANQSRLAYVLTVPVMALVLFAFTSKEGEHSVAQLAESIDAIAEPVIPPSIHESVFDQEDRYRPSILPLKTDATFKVSSTFGMRTVPGSDEKKMHNGMDLACAVGTEVVATADGEVTEVVASPDGYGNHIVIHHGDTYVTKYAQLDEFKVKGGDKVVKGQVIALSGNSGQSTGPHLHYEVYEKGKLMNPMDFVKNYSFKVKAVNTVPTAPKQPDSGDLVVTGIAPEVAAQEFAKAEEARAAAVEVRAEAIVAEKLAVKAAKQAQLSAEVAELQSEQAAVAHAEAAQIAAEDRTVLRNKTMLADTNPPLYILDGKRIMDISQIEPEDIEQINVLKGESAIAQYGADGEFGVIVITSKKSKKK